MKRVFVLGAAVLAASCLFAQDVFAQRGGFRGFGGGGVRAAAIGGGFGGGGVRAAAIGGGGFRAAAIGAGGMRAVGIGAPGFRGVGIAGGPAIRRAGVIGAPGVIGRPGLGVVRRPAVRWAGWRRGWGWGFPVAAGLAAASYYAYADAGYDSCLAWDGYQWVNVCYSGYYPY
jgi:hypothetical protein